MCVQLLLKHLLDGKGRVREECQLRVETDMDWVESIRAALVAGAITPPIVVFFDRDLRTYYIGGGIHRTWGHLKAGRKYIDADVRQGTLRDARFFAAGDNRVPGVKDRSPMDKRKAVMAIIEDPEWGQRSNRWIADHCGVSPGFVDDRQGELVAYRRHLAELEGKPAVKEKKTRVGRDGKTYRAPTRRKQRKGRRKAPTLPSPVAPPTDPASEIGTLLARVEVLTRQLAKLTGRSPADAIAAIAVLRGCVAELAG